MGNKKNRNSMAKRSKKKVSAKKPLGISACLIVKNEEKLLSRCLTSIEGLVDEIIVVDTGSTDKTVEIAESYGAKVYHHPWENDFSKHRNQSIQHASGDWVFVIDADEEVVRWDSNIDSVIQDKSIDTVQVVVQNAFGGGEGTAWHNSIRLFRNEKSIINGDIRAERA